MGMITVACKVLFGWPSLQQVVQLDQTSPKDVVRLIKLIVWKQKGSAGEIATR